jgi:thiamine biosynthesis lipoprotein
VFNPRCLKKIACAACVLLLIAVSGCGRPPPPIERESFVFGTRVNLLIASAPEPKADEAAAAVLREFDRLHRAYHAWQPSELTAVNEALAAGRSVTVGPELRDFIFEARALAAQGEYRFDPGIGRLIELWGFHTEDFQPQLPDAAALAAWRKNPASIAQLRQEGETLSSDNPALALDFGGYLKGVALDRAAVILKAHGIKNALINIGGNVMALGDKNGKPWKVGIQHPRQPGPLAILELRDGEAIGTSGDYQRYFELAGQRYSHLIDPTTAAPVRHTQAVTVLIPPGDKAGTLSDALSKPVFIAGSEDWQAVAQKIGAPAVLRVDASGEIQITPALNARLDFVGKPVVKVMPDALN